MMNQELEKYIRSIKNFPKDGIDFKDITTLLKDPKGLLQTGNALYDFAKEIPIDKVVGIESRGFFYGPLLAMKLQAGFVPIRKTGKLPAETVHQTYALEYGSDTIEVHKDAIAPGDKILLHDDLLATGGTARAACDLIEKAGGEIVQISFIIELAFLNAREKFEGYDLRTLIRYDKE
ncbi:adenine phosphoribosyltransferase [Rapidithrix thailandica]|uniref:Adenine phosphoribosyltransferase n=1 Tax=Rapidithrix thailandica TaxID=413964 RepID=A0AAW9S3Z8_9BACT